MPDLKKINQKKVRTEILVTRETLSLAARSAGFKGGIAEMCRKLKISRNTAYEAISNPRIYPGAHPRIMEALNAN